MIPMIQLSLEERAMEVVLDEAGLLHDMERDHFHNKKDVVVGCCPDGRHYLRGVLNPFVAMYDELDELCFMPLPRYGGTLILDDNSPLVLPGRTTDLDYIDDIRWASKNGYGAMCNINHFPCGKGREHKIHPYRIVNSLANAKQRIKKGENIEMTVANFLQISDISLDRRRLARIPYNDYIAWRDRLGEEMIYEMVREVAAYKAEKFFKPRPYQQTLGL